MSDSTDAPIIADAKIFRNYRLRIAFACDSIRAMQSTEGGKKMEAKPYWYMRFDVRQARALIDERGLSRAEVARLAGVSSSFLYYLTNPKPRAQAEPRVSTVKKIIDALS